MQLRPTFYALAILLAISSSACQNEATDPSEAPTSSPVSTAAIPQNAVFDIPAAKITYRFSGVEKGTLTFYFDNYGKRWVRDASFTIMRKITKKERRFWDGTQQVFFEQNERLNKAKEAVRTSSNNNKAMYFGSFSNMEEAQITKSNRFRKLTDAKIAEKTCAVYTTESTGQYYYIWEGITLKMRSDSRTFQATSVELIDEIPAELLKVPEGFEVKE
ncbi:MAG: hypothetical protein AAF798_15515 [Bacteroidota bacterium]